jgi:hypothetical protein
LVLQRIPKPIFIPETVMETEAFHGGPNELSTSTQFPVVVPDTEDQDEYHNARANERWIRCHNCNDFAVETLDRVCAKCKERY